LVFRKASRRVDFSVEARLIRNQALAPDEKPDRRRGRPERQADDQEKEILGHTVVLMCSTLGA
jgi:hypothetical protein